ncbi:37S ribosomal protein S16, mitochondrial [Vanrija pseudolonga]|uniref:37S ribosomal protein S16, mitochondrial n=1 Tax=Vanrija pseudolonga TaxID=143232 RepID=A0AAF0YH96_9TREE|nr:37S ribosomal protein S16, mitochondrial [Vanrija pseudolonga]
MPVRLRLARHGQRHTPVFHIVAINSSKRRDARPLEKLGEYDPIPRVPASTKIPSSSYVFGEEKAVLQKEKRIEWNVERIRYWLGVGAQPSRPVVKLLERAGILTTPHPWQHPWSPPPPAADAAATPAATTPAAAEPTAAPKAEA